MKSCTMLSLVQAVTTDVMTSFGFCSDKDNETLARREANEPLFLEVTLPSLDDALLTGLSQGCLPEISGWAKGPGGHLPRFMYDLWLLVFSPEGSLLSCPSPVAIAGIRQITRVYKKISEVCDTRFVTEALDRFVAEDFALSKVKYPSYMGDLLRVSRYLFRGIVDDMMASWFKLPFGHGPGAVAEKYDSISRWGFDSVDPKLIDFCGVTPFRVNHRAILDRPVVEEVTLARIVAVPKTATKPRLISIEPSYNQFIQQGFGRTLFKGLDRVDICSISDQSLNKRLARVASLTPLHPEAPSVPLSTVDLSSASDRVHFGLLKSMFAWSPDFVWALSATRSDAVDVGDGRIHVLNKFASMGSALTFPVETMYFTTLVVYAGLISEGRDVCSREVRRMARSREIRVYGDDIICPSSWIPTLYRLFSECGLVVNEAKSFTEGNFRESCGGDYWCGVDVTPVYARKRIPAARHESDAIVSWVSFHNQFRQRWGDGQVSYLLRSLLQPFGVPSVDEEWEVTPKVDKPWFHLFDARDFPIALVNGGPPVTRWNTDLQRVEVRVMRLSPKRRRVQAPDHCVLFKALCGPDEERPDHLVTHGRPVSAKLKYGWLGKDD